MALTNRRSAQFPAPAVSPLYSLWYVHYLARRRVRSPESDSIPDSWKTCCVADTYLFAVVLDCRLWLVWLLRLQHHVVIVVVVIFTRLSVAQIHRVSIIKMTGELERTNKSLGLTRSYLHECRWVSQV